MGKLEIPKNLTSLASESAVRAFEEHINSLVECVQGLEIYRNNEQPFSTPTSIFEIPTILPVKSTSQSTVDEFQDVCEEFYKNTSTATPKPVITIHTNSPDKLKHEDDKSSSKIESSRWRKDENNRFLILEDSTETAIRKLAQTLDREREQLNMTGDLSDDDEAENSKNTDSMDVDSSTAIGLFNSINKDLNFGLSFPNIASLTSEKSSRHDSFLQSNDLNEPNSTTSSNSSSEPPQVYHFLKLTNDKLNPTFKNNLGMLLLNQTNQKKHQLTIDEINFQRSDFDDYSRAALTLGDLFQLKYSLPSDIHRFNKFNLSKHFYRKLLDHNLPINIPMELTSRIIQNFKEESGKLFLFCSELLYQIQLAEFDWKSDTRVRHETLDLSNTYIQNWKMLESLKTYPGFLKSISFANFSFAFSDSEHLENGFKIKRFVKTFLSVTNPAEIETHFREDDRDIVSEDFCLIFMKIMNLFIDDKVERINLSGVFRPMWLVWQDAWATAHTKYFNHEKRLLNWMVKSRLKSTCLKSLNFSFTSLQDDHLEIIVKNCKNLEELNISNTLVSDLECLRPIAKKIRVLKATSIRFDLNYRIQKLEMFGDLIDDEKDFDFDNGDFSFSDKPTYHKNEKLWKLISTISANTYSVIKLMKKLKVLHLGHAVSEKFYNHLDTILQQHVLPVQSELRPATVEFKHLLLEYGYEHSGILNETKSWTSTGDKENDKKKFTGLVDKVLCNIKIYEEIWNRFLDSEEEFYHLEEILFSEFFEKKKRKLSDFNLVDRLPSLNNMILPGKNMEYFSNIGVIEQLEQNWVRIDCACEGIDTLENIDYCLNMIKNTNNENKSLTQALNVIFNYTSRNFNNSLDNSKTQEMVDALINCTTIKAKELSCLKEFYLKFYRFYKKIQLENLEKDADPMNNRSPIHRARPAMPFHQNFSAILHITKKKENVFTGLDDYFQLLQALTAVYYNLLSDRAEVSKKVSKQEVPRIVNSTLDILELTVISSDFMRAAKNCLLILCQETALSAEFNFFRASQLILLCLDRFGWDSEIPYPDQLNIRRLTVAIVSILASKVGTDQTPQLGSKQFLSRVIQCSKDRFSDTIKDNLNQTDDHHLLQQARSIDAIYKYSLSALWNLTDESPKSCEVFIEEDGLEICLSSLKLYDDEEIRVYYKNKEALEKNTRGEAALAILNATKDRVEKNVQLYGKVENINLKQIYWFISVLNILFSTFCR